MAERLLGSPWMQPSQLVPHLEPGDCIEFDRISERMPYSHWGIYCGIVNGERMIAHLSTEHGDFGDSGSGSQEFYSKIRHGTTAHIRSDPYSVVAGRSHRARINNWLDRYHTPFPPCVILRRVERKMGHTGYNLMINNCEQFAKWARNGRAQSDQASTLTTCLTVIGGLAATGSLPVALSAGAIVASSIFVARRVLPQFVFTAQP